MKFKQIRHNLITDLKQIGIDKAEAEREAQLILEHATGMLLAEQIINESTNLTSAQLATINTITAKRRLREPLQYCLGYAYFLGLKLKVKPGVFIPRTDTEILVTTTYAMMRSIQEPLIAEIGIGSGAISIGLLKHLPQSKVIAMDISQDAIELSRQNAQDHHVLDRLSLICRPWTEALPTHLDAIVSNPPYIPLSQRPSLDKEVADFEPAEALFGSDADGLGFYRQFATKAPHHLKPNGFIALEFGDGQHQAVSEIFSASNWQNIEIHQDINRLPRLITALRPIKLA